MNLGGALNAYEDELRPLEQAGIRALACLLNLPSHVRIFESWGFSFLCWPIANGQPPSQEQIVAIVHFVDDCRARQQPVAVFCEAGLGRTGTVIAVYLIRKGMSAREAISLVRSKEPSAVETLVRIKFLEEFERDHPYR